jgi:hypothetical protein
LACGYVIKETDFDNADNSQGLAQKLAGERAGADLRT